MLVGLVGIPASALEISEEGSIDHLVITEVQTGSSESASQEFIELYNPTDTEIFLSNFALQYQPASGTGWKTKSSFSEDDVIEAQGYYLLSTVDYFDDLADGHISSGLAASSGSIRIVETYDDGESIEEVQHDLVGWGGAYSFELSAIESHGTGQSLKRYFDEDGQVVDTDDNSFDIFISDTPYPQSSTSKEVESSDEEVVEDAEDAEDAEDVEKEVTYLSIDITELFIDPKPPQSDADDEFIEFYNMHPTTVDLTGYVLKTGNSLNHSYTLKAITIEPGQFIALYSRDTNLTLANSGGRAVLFDPDGVQVSQTPSYTNANAGQSFSLINSDWVFSSTPTPAAKNIFPKTSIDNVGQARSGATISKRSYPKVHISELFIDPGSPLKDADDEFVEIYNPNDFAVKLEDYQIQSGSTYRYKFTLPKVTIKPKQYLVFYSAQSGLTLSNKEGRARIVDPNGNELHASKQYIKAKVDTSWVLVNGEWIYTTSPTPGDINVATSLNKEVLGDSTTGEASISGDDLLQKVLREPAMINQSFSSNLWVILFLGIATVYAIWEFRFDLRNSVHIWQEKRQS